MAQDILKRLKANRVKVGIGEPNVNEGANGDFSLRRTTSGIVLYIKHENKWYSVGQLQAVGGRGQGRSEGKHKIKTDNLEVGRQIVIDGKSGRQLKLTANEIDCASGNFTLDAGADIELNADGGQVTIKDNTASHFLFDCDNTRFTIYDDTDEADYFLIQVGASGATALQTVDAGSNIAHLDIRPDGWINLMSGGDEGDIAFKKEDTMYAKFSAHHNLSDLRIFENEGASENDYLSIQVGAHGATELITVDAAAAAASFKVTADGDINLDSHEVVILDGRDTAAAGHHIAFKANGTRFGHLTGTSGGASDFQLFERGGDSTDDWFRIRVSEHGDTNIQTYDTAGANAHLTLASDGHTTIDSAAEIVLDQTDRMKFKKAGTEYARMDTDGSSQFTMYEQGGASTDDFFQITCATHGATKLATHDNSATAANLTFDADGDITLDAASGNIYVKDNGGNYTPGSDYEIATKKYVDDNAGGTDTYCFSTQARCRTQYNNWYMPNTLYGINYYYWVSTTGSTGLPLSYLDSYIPGFIVPKNGTITSYTIIGNISTTDTWEWAILKGAQPTYGSAGNYTMSNIGATQSAGGTASILYKWEQTGLSTAVNAGDMLLPYFRRTTDNDTSYSYCEMSMSILMG